MSVAILFADGRPLPLTWSMGTPLLNCSYIERTLDKADDGVSFCCADNQASPSFRISLGSPPDNLSNSSNTSSYQRLVFSIASLSIIFSTRFFQSSNVISPTTMSGNLSLGDFITVLGFLGPPG